MHSDLSAAPRRVLQRADSNRQSIGRTTGIPTTKAGIKAKVVALDPCVFRNLGIFLAAYTHGVGLVYPSGKYRLVYNWKAKELASIKESKDFFGNPNKLEREM